MNPAAVEPTAPLGLRINLSLVEKDTLAMNRCLSPGSAVTANYEGESTQPPLLTSDANLKIKSKRLGGATPAFSPASQLNMVSFADQNGHSPAITVHHVYKEKKATVIQEKPEVAKRGTNAFMPGPTADLASVGGLSPIKGARKLKPAVGHSSPIH